MARRSSSEARCPFGTTRVSSDWPNARIRRLTGTFLVPFPSGEGSSLLVTQVVLDHDRIAGVAAQNVLPFPVPLAKPDEPGKQGAQNRADENNGTVSTHLLEDAIQHGSGPFQKRSAYRTGLSNGIRTRPDDERISPMSKLLSRS